MRTNIQVKHTFYLAVFLGITLFYGAIAAAGDWPQWRGPNHNGSTVGSNLPVSWSTTENVVWSADLPGYSEASPIVVGDRVFVASNDESQTKLYAICLDRDTGKTLWSKLITDSARASSRNSMASCSPVSDGERVFFMFGSGDLYAMDLDGNIIWSQNLGDDYGPFASQWGYSSTPLIYNNRLYVTVMRGTQTSQGATDENSFLLCLEPATGKVLFKIHRTSDARGESQDSYTSPVPYEFQGHSQIVLSGADYITGHDAILGDELWRHPHNPRKIQNWRLIPSPVIANDVVIGVEPRGGSAFAVKPTGDARMRFDDAAWVFDAKTTDVPTPPFYDGRLYILNGARRIMTCVNPITGEEIWSGDLGGRARIWSSPTAADGKIYCLNEQGTTIVLAAGDTFKILGEGRLGGAPSKSTIAIADERLFIRTAEKLYCIALPGT